MALQRRGPRIFALGILMAPLGAGAQPQTSKVPRIGILAPSPIAARSHLHEAFLHGLRELGYVEGQNIAIESAGRRGSSSGSPTSRPSWSASRWTSS